jgi:hypothetical protein
MMCVFLDEGIFCLSKPFPFLCMRDSSGLGGVRGALILVSHNLDGDDVRKGIYALVVSSLEQEKSPT